MNTIVFGHLGNRNLHCNVSPAADRTHEQVVQLTKQFQAIVHEVFHRLGRSISAEHRVGQHKRDDCRGSSVRWSFDR